MTALAIDIDDIARQALKKAGGPVRGPLTSAVRDLLGEDAATDLVVDAVVLRAYEIHRERKIRREDRDEDDEPEQSAEDDELEAPEAVAPRQEAGTMKRGFYPTDQQRADIVAAAAEIKRADPRVTAREMVARIRDRFGVEITVAAWYAGWAWRVKSAMHANGNGGTEPASKSRTQTDLNPRTVATPRSSAAPSGVAQRVARATPAAVEETPCESGEPTTPHPIDIVGLINSRLDQIQFERDALIEDIHELDDERSQLLTARAAIVRLTEGAAA